MLIIELAGWLVFSLILMSFIEHQVHCRLMHRPSGLSARYLIFKKMREHHAVLHHGTYHAHFTDEPVGKGEDRGIRLSVKQGLLETLPLTLFFALFSVPGAIVFASVVAWHHLTWNLFHLEMHKPRESYFTRFRAYKCVARTHFVHHKMPSKNFNVVLPLADYVLGTRAKFRHCDLVEMYDLKLLNRQTRDFQSRFSKKKVERQLVGARSGR